MRVDEQCKVLCRIDSLSGAQAKAFRNKIEDDYRVNMCVPQFKQEIRPSALLMCSQPSKKARENDAA